MMTDPLAPAREALARHDWQAALDAAKTAAAPNEVSKAERSDLIADATWWLGRLDDCIEARQAAYRGYDELGNHRRAGQCAVWLFEHYAFGAHPAVASGWLQRARRALGDDPECEEYAALALREAEVAHGAGDLDAALTRADEIVVLARRLRSANVEAEALQTMGRVLIDRGDVASGMAHLDEAMLFAVEGRLGPYSTGKVYCSLISACEDVGDFDRAAEWTEATMQWSQQHPFAIFPGICRVHRAAVLKRRGEFAEAEAEALRAGDELRSSHRGNCAAAYVEVGDIRRRLGELDRAEEAFAQATQIAGGQCAELALLRLAQGRVSTARSVIDSCLSSAPGSRLARARLLPVAVQVAIAAGDLQAAQAAIEELEVIATTYDSAVLQATALSSRGRLQLANSDPLAATTLQQAVNSWQALHVPYEVATSQTLLGQGLRLAGDESGASAAFGSAVAIFDQVGARLEARLALGNHRGAHPAGLTDREVEVLRLIAAGRTNNEIAADLFLSTKTVSRHLSNIFTKIGVTSRAGATAYAFEHELVDRGG